jgi:hypothetical protein
MVSSGSVCYRLSFAAPLTIPDHRIACSHRSTGKARSTYAQDILVLGHSAAPSLASIATGVALVPIQDSQRAREIALFNPGQKQLSTRAAFRPGDLRHARWCPSLLCCSSIAVRARS